MKRSATASLMRKLNRSAVLDLIRGHGPIARSEIARQLNMSIPTVMRVMDDLFSNDLVRWSGDSEVSGGRPRSLLEFNGDGYAVIGLDLGGTSMYGSVADLCGSIQHEVHLPFDNAIPDDNLGKVCSLIETLLAWPRPASQLVRGIGVGAPGITLSEEGIVTWAPSLGWRDLPLKAILTQRFNLPVVVENDVNLAALGEYGFGAARGASSAVCVALGTGIGCGIVIDGKIYRGYTQSAGEIGYMPPTTNYLGRRYETFGALESLASGTAIQLRARDIMRQGNPLDHSETPSIEEIFQAALRNERWAQQVFDETVDYLSLAIAAISTILDPEVIVLGGSVVQSAEFLIESILIRLEGVVPSTPKLVISQLGSHAALMGAIMVVQEMTTEHVSIKDWA